MNSTEPNEAVTVALTASNEGKRKLKDKMQTMTVISSITLNQVSTHFTLMNKRWSKTVVQPYKHTASKWPSWLKTTYLFFQKQTNGKPDGRLHSLIA